MAINFLQTTVVDLFDDWAKSTPEAAAVEWHGQTLDYARVRDASLHVSKALLASGVGPGDKIPIISQMSLELVPSILGVLRTGACYVPVDLAGWSKARVDATVEDLSPPVVLATSKLEPHGFPDIIRFEEQWLRSSFDDTETDRQLEVIRRNLDTKALIYVTFTSGTTGKPKGVMIYHQALHRFVAQTHGDSLVLTPGERMMTAFSISFDAFAATLWLTITRGGTLVMAPWSSIPEIGATCDTWISTPSMLATLDPAGPYDKVRKICLGSELTNLEVARSWITPKRKVTHSYGPSECTINIAYGKIPEGTEPDLGVLNPGVEVFLVDSNLQESDVGEILIGGWSVGAGYLNNLELTTKKFIDWNGRRVYRTGDVARRTATGFSWVGRADRIVKNRGFLVNLETEVETAMLRFPDVRVSSAFMWRGRLVGFVQPETVNVEEMRAFMKKNFDPFVVPDEILALDTFPVTTHAKVDRAALHDQLEARMTGEDAKLAAMVCHSPYDGLRLAFARCLQVPFNSLDGNSSFSQLGGNSLAAMTLAKLLRQQGYIIPILQIIRGDTIGHLESNLTASHDLERDPRSIGIAQIESQAVPATDMHRLMLTQSQRNPRTNCLMARVKFAGAQDLVPTPGELLTAWRATLEAHSIFKTRYDLQSWTLHDLDHINLEWEEVSVDADDFDSALASLDEQIWARHKSLQSLRNSDLEVPYCHMTCVYAPGRKAIGFVWRIHHVLTDIFSFFILLHDLEKALSKEKLASGPLIREYSHFMQQYKSEKLGTATEFWKRMMEPLGERSLFDFRPPQTPSQSDGWCTLNFPTRETVQSIEAAVLACDVSSATLIFAAWALVLSKYTCCDFVSLYLSRSGRMVPWPLAPSLVGALNCRVPFATGVPTGAKAHEWLLGMHGKLDSVAELENLCQSLDTSIYPAEYFKTGVQAFLYMPQSPASWKVYDRLTGQAEPIGMVWRVQSTADGAVEAELEIDQRVVDVKWAREVGAVAVRMLEGLTNAQKNTTLGDLLSD